MILNEAITWVYSELTPIKSDSPTITIHWVVIPTINDIQKQICLWQVTNMMDRSTTYKATKLDFLTGHLFIDKKRDWILKEELNIGDNEIKTDISLFPNSGYIMINENIIKYTGKDPITWKLTGVDWIKLSCKSGASIKPLTEYPDDCGYTSELINVLNPDRPIASVDERWEKQVSQYYTVKSNWEGLRFFFLNTWEWQYKLSYVKKPTTLTDPNDNLILPDELINSVLIPLVAWIILYGRFANDPYLGQQKGVWALTKAYNSLQTYYGQEAIEEKTYRKKVKRSRWKR